MRLDSTVFHALRPMALLALLAAAMLSSGLAGAEDTAWTERETRLANQYLALLGEQPEYGRVLELLWNLYAGHDATSLLLENIATQAEASKHPSVMLVRAHLVRRSGDLKGSVPLYEAVLEKQPDSSEALRALADVSMELGDGSRALELQQALAELLPDGSIEKVRAWIEVGHLALHQELPDDAAQAWERAGAMRPDDLEIVREVARLLLQAGKPQKAAEFLTQLIDKTDPGQRLEALQELARIQAHADDFPAAQASLRQALGMLHFRDARYAQTFLRLVRLHEQFGKLDALRQSLTEAATADGAGEQALADMARFFEIVVEPDGRITWLRKLVELSPKDDSYRWELTRALLTHEGTSEAATLLDERLKGDGTDFPEAVFLRCDAHLRAGEGAEAATALEKVLEKQGRDPEVENRVLTFARQKALDEVVRGILETRLARDPSNSEAVFELAGYHRARRESDKVDAVLTQYIADGVGEDETSKRRNEAADFMVSGMNLDGAIALAREAAEQAHAGRLEWVRLADLLAEKGDFEEAAAFLEKAWSASNTYQDRADVDERLLSVLMGGQATAPERVSETTTEFQLPAAFTGAGFASSDPAPAETSEMPKAVQTRATEAMERARADDATGPEIWRGASWALAAGDLESAYEALRKLLLDGASSGDETLRREAESLLLDVAQVDENRALTLRQLRRMIALEPEREIPLTLRLSEQLFMAEQQADSITGRSADDKRHGIEASELLEGALKRHPDSEQLLSALTQIYVTQGRGDEALAMWKAAADRAEGTAAVPLLERYAELLLSAQQVQEHIEIQMSLLQREADVKRRREAFRRFLDRLAWRSLDGGGSLSPNVVEDRLRMVGDQLRAQLVRHPFDAFYHEALAQVFQRMGDHTKAFAEMKQAYYTAPETPFSLHQLRDAAARVNDLEAAIYFQKQIAATAPAKEMASESRRLVEMLEQTFQIEQADRVRLRLESRSAQDADALLDLAGYYETTGQDEAELRVLEQLVQVRPWDVQARLRLGLKHLDLAQETDARMAFEQALNPKHTPEPPKSATAIATAGRVPLPLVNERKSDATSPLSELIWQLDSAQGLTTAEVSDLRGFLSLPRPELSRTPQAANFARLRVIEELAKLKRSTGGTALNAWIDQWSQSENQTVVERFWALHYAGDGTQARKLLPKLLESMRGTEALFCQLWMRLVTHGMDNAVRWASQVGLDSDALDQRQRLLQACTLMLVDVESFHFQEHELNALGNSKVLRNSVVLEITRKFQDRGRYKEALALGDTLRKNSTGLAADYAFFLSRVAESAQRWDVARDYLGQVLSGPGPVSSGAYKGTYDAFLFSLGALDRMAITAAEREDHLSNAWSRLQRTPESSLTSLRRSAITGMGGLLTPAADRLETFMMEDLLVGRRLGEERGGLMPQSMSRSEEPPYLGGFWEEAREIGSGLTQQGLGDVVGEVNERIHDKWGSVLLSSQSGSEFHEWRLQLLIRRVWHMNHPERMQEIREYLSTVDMEDEVSVDVLSELGGRLEAMGMAREAVAVYQLLVKRAKSNPDFAQWMIRACDSARMIEPGRSFCLQLLRMPPPLKPAQLGDETLRENHARFLAMDFDDEALSQHGFLDEVTVVRIGRIPPEVPYLRELAKLLERLGRKSEALEAWERLHTAMASNIERGLAPDTEACLKRAQYHRDDGRTEAALAALREIELEDPLSEMDEEALALRGELLAETGAWEEFTELMTLAVRKQSLVIILALSEQLGGHEREPEALNFLIQSERSLKGDLERFQLRKARLHLASRSPDWKPTAHRTEMAALFRTHVRDRESLEELMAWMADEARSTQSEAWSEALQVEMRQGGDRVVAAMAATAFSETPIDAILSVWTSITPDDATCLEIAARHLWEGDRFEDAWQVCRRYQHLAAEMDGVKRWWPLMVTIAASRKDRATIMDLFTEALRLPFDGAEDAAAWTVAFEKAGHPDMAEALLNACRDRLETRGEPAVYIFPDWARFLIRQRRFEEAETFLLNRLSMIPSDAANILLELYTAWSKLDVIGKELPKFHLASGIEKELLFRVEQQREAPATLPDSRPKP
mgnify:CR=1 FL=1